MNEKQYKELIEVASKLCNKKQSEDATIEPTDLVADAFVELIEETENPLFLELCRKKIKSLYFKERDASTQTYIDKGQQVVCSTCKNCKNSKPLSEFYLYTDKSTGLKTIPMKWCRKCMKDYYSVYWKLPEGIEKNKKNFKKYHSLNKEKWNDYLQGRYKKEKENLSDNYLRKLLRGKFKNNEITEEMIKQKRMIIKNKLLKLT